jgi:glycosyltransferase involved in cell wall biosynthesis
MSQTKQLRILHVLGSMDPGGLETWLLQVLKDINRNRFQLYFCTCGPQLGFLATEVTRLGGVMLPCARGTNVWSFSRRFRKILREGSFDVVHSHLHYFSGAVLRWSNWEGVPIRIAHSHNAHDGKRDSLARRYYRRIMKSWISRYATHGLAPSELAVSELFGKNWQTDKRLQILDYGLDLNPFQELFDRDGIRAELGIPKDAPVVGHVGRFDRPKNHRFLLEVADAVLKCRPDVHFLLIGDGVLRPEIEVQARQMGLSREIHLVGVRTDVPRLMLAAMDLFLFPSLYEGLGICLLEAQAAGLRCLVSDAVPKEVVRIPSSMEFLPLSAGKGYWATKIIQDLDARRTRSVSVPNAEAQDKFSMQRSLRHLMDLYSTAHVSMPLSTAEQQHV